MKTVVYLKNMEDRTGPRVYMALLIAVTMMSPSCGNFPLLDVDTNMRIVLIPHDTPVGTIVYRVRATDSDNNFPLKFEVLGALGKSLLDLKFLGCSYKESLCQADVMLRKKLDIGRTYEFQIQVQDTMGDFTKVQSVISATSTSIRDLHSSFDRQRIIRVAEDTEVGSVLDTFVVLKNEANSRSVLLEIRDDDEKFLLKQKLVSKNGTEGTIILNSTLDYEQQPWFTFKLLAMNAHTNVSVDTRNILISDVVVLVENVQDTPPSFIQLPAPIQLNNTLTPGDLVAHVQAVDGDLYHKRLIRYGFLSDSNPFVSFFELDQLTGEIRLKRKISELFSMARPNEPIELTVIAEEIPGNDTMRATLSSDNSSSRIISNISFWFPKSISVGPPIFSSDKYVAKISENVGAGTLLKFSPPPLVYHNNPEELIKIKILSLEDNKGMADGTSDLIESIPSEARGNFSLELRIKEGAFIDYEVTKLLEFKMQATSSMWGQSSESKLIIHVTDENDNSPVFTQEEYEVELPENSPKGTTVTRVLAEDKDSEGSYGEIVYKKLLGSDAFHIDPFTGDVVVEKPELLDREVEPEIRLYLEARDGGYRLPENRPIQQSTQEETYNAGTALLTIKLTDKNDNPPVFIKSFYQAILNPSRTAFKYPVYVQATDLDEGVNGRIRYQTEDPQFFVESATGELRLRSPYNPKSQAFNGPYLGSVKIKAYDFGRPPMSSETLVQIYSEEMVSREIQFVFPFPPEKIRSNQSTVEQMLSSLTGGVVEIQEVVPIYDRNIGRREYVQSRARLEHARFTPAKRIGGEGKDNHFSQDLSSAGDKSLVTATVQYPVTATPTRVDLAAWQRAYMKSAEAINSSTVARPPPNKGKDKKDDKGDKDTVYIIEKYKAENRALLWILIILFLLLLVLFAIFLCCLYCPCCWLYGHFYRRNKVEDRRISQVEVAEDRRKSLVNGNVGHYHHKESQRHVQIGQSPMPTVHQKREAWSGDEVEVPRWRQRPQAPQTDRRVQKISGPRDYPSQEVVDMEDWEIESQYLRNQYRKEPSSEFNQRAPAQMQQRLAKRVVYAGGRHPGDEVQAPSRQVMAGYVQEEIDDAGVPQIPEPSAVSVKSRKTRFFKTESGEVLQFDEDGKDILLRRFIEEQKPSGTEIEELPETAPKNEDAITFSNRPKAALKRSQSSVAEDAAQPSPEKIIAHEKMTQESSSRFLEKKEESNKDKEENSFKTSQPKVASLSNSSVEEESKEKTTERRYRSRSKSKEAKRSEKSEKIKKKRSKSKDSKKSSKSKEKSKKEKTHSLESSLNEKSVTEEGPEDKEEELKSIIQEEHKEARKPITDKQSALEMPGKTDNNFAGVEISVIPPSSAATPSTVGSPKKGEVKEPKSVEDEVLQKENVAVEPSTKDTTAVSHSSAHETQGKEVRAEQIGTKGQNSRELTTNKPVLVEGEDDDSGIGVYSTISKRNKILEKKSIFTIAYDDMAQSSALRPQTGSNES